ncbi:hypothetical protein Ctha_1925 [Chloroherpeton thalassium ATCC 35110]|uniref:Uncharacterized protein n=1 Tax=Chloroherpeton thalassium (strain ATCC 35110 / GB-78) TaxID=517418 RepID=B3QUD0_CHLT3|nr:hypothetical protein [Chloroherpeton thalassium]ACF14379.1 hypothetical protein Ctha_1925 [Chloroherpeton thalassium ATCC 35110]
MRNLLNSGVLIILMVCGVCFSTELKAQDKNDPMGVTGTTVNSDKSKVLQDIELNTVSIKYKVQTPRVKFTMERLPVDIKINYEKLESLKNVIKQEPKRLIFMSKKFEKPVEFSPSSVVEHTVSGSQ